MKYLDQAILIVSTLIASWLGMQVVHELGHVLGAWLTGGTVAKVVLHPLAISRTDLARNSHPLIVAWAGPLIGTLLPLGLWGLGAASRATWSFLPRFFAGFCLIANGAYIGCGAFVGVGDAQELLRHGAPARLLGAFGVVCVALGLWLWHRQGRHFGLGPDRAEIGASLAYSSTAVCVALVVLGLVLDRFL